MILLGWLACITVDSGGKPGADDTASTTTDAIVVTTLDGTSDANGYFKVPVHIDAPGTVLQVNGRRDGFLSIDYLTAGRGQAVFDWEDWAQSNESLTDCFYLSEGVTTFDWPIRQVDGELAPGDYQVWVATLSNRGAYVGNQDVSTELLLRVDDDFTTGTLHAVIAYAEGVDEDPAVVTATESAAAYWQQLYASWGITLEIEFSTIAIDADLPSSSVGADAYEAFAEALPERRVILIVGESLLGDPTLYGEAGGIPGPYGPARTGIVGVGWSANAGPDGNFSEDDVLLYGETMAHEMGHYLGLYHPVESTYNYWDALEDTEACTTWQRCESVLGENLMFPYPICIRQSCSRQDQLTGEQQGVAHRYIGVN